MRAIQQELGEKNPEQAEVDLLRERLEKADLPDDIRKELERELGRLEKLPSSSPEHNVLRSYIDLVLELPVEQSTRRTISTSRMRGRCSMTITSASRK